MVGAMVRKQVYLERDQDRKLKALAARRKCTEAEIIREALDRLPDPESDDIVARLEAAGLLVPKPEPGLPTEDEEGKSSEELWAEWDTLLANRNQPLGLVEALRKDRDSR